MSERAGAAASGPRRRAGEAVAWRRGKTSPPASSERANQETQSERAGAAAPTAGPQVITEPAAPVERRGVDLALRVGGAVVSLWGAVVLAVAGAFLTPFRVGAVLVPVSVLLAVVGNAVLVWFARRTTRHKFLTVAPGLVWLGVTFFALDRTTEGDLVLYQQNWVSMVYLLAGAATVAFLGYRALVPEAPFFGPR